MSMYIDFDGEQYDQLSTNKGWGDFTRWAESGPPELAHFAEHSWCQNPGALLAELRHQMEVSPPEETVTSTLNRLIETLQANEDAETVAVNDGMAEDDGEDDSVF